MITPLQFYLFNASVVFLSVAFLACALSSFFLHRRVSALEQRNIDYEMYWKFQRSIVVGGEFGGIPVENGQVEFEFKNPFTLPDDQS